MVDRLVILSWGWDSQDLSRVPRLVHLSLFYAHLRCHSLYKVDVTVVKVTYL